jgi:1-aminocyclopropane-1-carboxylate deaminase
MLSLHCLDSEQFPSCIVSYGGPQSNSMLAIAAVVHYQNSRESPGDTVPRCKRFVYYTKKLPRFLRNQPSGNLFRALSLGMELVELANDEYQNLLSSAERSVDTAPPQLPPPVYGDSVWIPQGGACSMALRGTEGLAEEIYEFWSCHGAHQPLSVCFPGGTCCTALLVHRALQRRKRRVLLEKNATPPLDIEVVVIPCVGDEAYARRQMLHLSQHVFGTTAVREHEDSLPAILKPAPEDTQRTGTESNSARPLDYFRFGEPEVHILETFRELRDEYDVVVDLLYGAPAWTLLFRHWTSSSTSASWTPWDPDAPIDGRRVLYVHSGGLEGINSQLLRYKYKKLVDMEEIQWPGRNPASLDE